MPPSIGASRPEPDDALADRLQEWRQGDYVLAPRQFVEIEGVEDGDLVPVADAVIGLAVVTQTCDIVNITPGKESVVVCPLREVSRAQSANIFAGRTPGAAVLEHPPAEDVVVDLNRMMSLRKEVLVGLKRQVGFTSDAARARFAESLQRKHGRFAFPDAFNEHVLGPLKDRIATSHDKDSEHGKAYRSIQTTRVRAAPNWEADAVTVGFYFILEDEDQRVATRDKIAETI